MFHRLTVPTYYGALPSGYDYINNAGGGTPAPADGAKSSGPNVGTYFVAFGEDATSSNTNRANKALAENCDYIDDLMRTSQVVVRYIEGTTPSDTDDFLISDDVYVGGNAETPTVVNDQFTRNGLMHFVDSSGNELVIEETVVVPSLIHNGSATSVVGVPASGFYTNPTVRASFTIPSGTAYRIYYLARRCLADIISNKPSEFFSYQMRSIEHVPSGLHLQGLSEKYHRNATYDPTPPTPWPETSVASAPGNGAWIKKYSYPVTGYVQRLGAGTVSGTLDDQDFLFGAAFAGQSDVGLTALGTPTLNTHRQGLGSGFVYSGNSRTFLEDPAGGLPGFFGFAHFANKRTATSANDLTRLNAGTGVASANTDQLTLAVPRRFYYNIGSADRSSFALGVDVLVLKETSSGAYHYVTIVEFTSALVGTMRYLDGSHPNIAGPVTMDIVEWLSPLFFSSENAVSYYSSLGLSNTLPPDTGGFMFCEPPGVRYGGTSLSPRRYARYFSGDINAASKALAWGGYVETSPTSIGARYTEKGYLYADGGAAFGGNVMMQADTQLDTLTVGGAAEFDDTVLFTAATTCIDEFIANGAASSSAANDALPAIKTTVAPVNWKLLWETVGSSAGMVRLYSTTTEFEMTQNAEWATSQWNRDDIAAPSVRYSLLSSGIFTVYTAAAAANPISWTTKYELKNTLVMSAATNGGAAGTLLDSEMGGTARNVQDTSVDISVTPTAEAGDIIEALATIVIHPNTNTTEMWLDAYYSGTDHEIPGTRQEFTGALDIHVCLKGRFTAPGVATQIHIRFQNTVAGDVTNFDGQYYLETKVIRP